MPPRDAPHLAGPLDSSLGPAVTAESAARALSFLREPSKTIVSVEESIDDDGTEFGRTVKAKLAFAAEEMIYIAQKPRKGVLLTIDVEGSQGPISVERLSHMEHRYLEQWLIFYRFWDWWESISVDPARVDDLVRLNPIIQKRLLAIPSHSESAANDIVHEIFGLKMVGDAEVQSWDGFTMDLLKFGSCRDQPAYHAVYDEEQYKYLKRLCVELRSRYYVAFRVTRVAPSDFRNVVLTYSYRQHYRVRRGDIIGRARSRSGSAPLAVRVHAPLARMTNHYSVSMPAQDGYYFASQSILFEKPGKNSTSHTTKDYGKGAAADTTVRVADTFWREVAGGSVAHLHLDGGDKVGNRVFVGLDLAERPPGSEGRAYGVVRVTLFAVVLLAIWKYANPDGGPVAALLASLLTLGGLAVQSTAEEVPLFRAPGMPRWIIGVQAYLSILFAVWLLSSPPIIFEFPSNWNRFGGIWHACGGIFVVVCLALLTVVAKVRLMRSFTRYEQAVLLRKYNRPSMQN
ncbi:hypothetical protein [Mycobacterium sp. SMC-4]|uniref:hypothetical protein n=1 Tax=Mycobacterium sp. SMC-4 TaxID=2857059 RepID=UPI003D0360E2